MLNDRRRLPKAALSKRFANGCPRVGEARASARAHLHSGTRVNLSMSSMRLQYSKSSSMLSRARTFLLIISLSTSANLPKISRARGLHFFAIALMFLPVRLWMTPKFRDMTSDLSDRRCAFRSLSQVI